MYLTGERFYTFDNRREDDEGNEIESINVRLGYWRKHANLHGYIVKTFAGGVDECQRIELSLENLTALLEVVKDPTQMAKTEGFFFGQSANDDDQIAEDTAQISKAIAFLTSAAITQKKGEWRSVIYRASW